MQIELGMTVWTEDGQEAGTIKRLVLAADQARVRGLVFRTGALIGRDVVVDEVEFTADEGRVRLKYTADELDSLPDFEARKPGDEVPAGDEAATYRHPIAPFVYGGTGVAATPPMSSGTGPDPSLDEGFRTEYNQAMARQTLGQIAVGEGSAVRSRDGEKIGEVKRLAFDTDSGKLTMLVVHKGLIFGEDYRLEPSLIASVGSDLIRLRATAAELKV